MTTGSDLPQSVWSGSFDLFGVKLRCHVLSDGQRIIEADSMAELFSAMTSNDVVPDDEEIMQQFAAWLHTKGLPQ